MRRRLLFASVLSISSLIITAVTPPRDLLLYNPSHSIPTSIYVRVEAAPRVGSIVTVRAVDVAPDYAALREFTGDGDRFKRVAAANGDTVCADDDDIEINTRTVAQRERRDAMGRSLPHWRGCRTLENGEVFLLGETHDSFDSRYFGVVRNDQIEGVWREL